MINKHLAGKHDQRRHGSKKSNRDARQTVLDKDYLSAVGKYEPIPGAFSYVAQKLFDKYPEDCYRLVMTPTIYLDTPSFSAKLAVQKRTANAPDFIMGLELRDVQNEQAAEAFVRETVGLVKQSGYRHMVLDGSFPVGLAADLGAKLVLGDPGGTDAGHLVRSAVDYLNSKYDLNSPVPDLKEASEWLRKTGAIYLDNSAIMKGVRFHSALLKDLLAIKHPKHPEIPLFIEYIAENNDIGYGLDLYDY